MKRAQIFPYLAAIALLAVVTIRPADAGTPPADDEAAVRSVVKQLQDAWNAHDGKAFAVPFAADADYVIVNGMKIKGREAIERGHTRIFTTVYKDSRNVATVAGVRFIRPDVAVAHVEWSLEYASNGQPEKGRAMNTLVLTKEAGEWRIAAFQNTPVTAPAN